MRLVRQPTNLNDVCALFYLGVSGRARLLGFPANSWIHHREHYYSLSGSCDLGQCVLITRQFIVGVTEDTEPAKAAGILTTIRLDLQVYRLLDQRKCFGVALLVIERLASRFSFSASAVRQRELRHARLRQRRHNETTMPNAQICAIPSPQRKAIIHKSAGARIAAVHAMCRLTSIDFGLYAGFGNSLRVDRVDWLRVCARRGPNSAGRFWYGRAVKTRFDRCGAAPQLATASAHLRPGSTLQFRGRAKCVLPPSPFLP
jgi:hypothetical protein